MVTQAMRDGRLIHAIGPMPEPTRSRDPGLQPHRRPVRHRDLRTRAARTEPDVLLAGRACDTAIFAALPELLGYPAALCLHMAKIIECTSLCCQPGGRDAMLAELGMDGFTLESMNPACNATPALGGRPCAVRTGRPFRGGRTVRHAAAARCTLRGAGRNTVPGCAVRRFVPRSRPSLKIEGASRIGARAVLLAGIADPACWPGCRKRLAAVDRQGALAGSRRLVTCMPHVYGQGAVRPLPPHAPQPPRSWPGGRVHRRRRRNWPVRPLPCTSRTCCTMVTRAACRPPATWPFPSPRASSTRTDAYRVRAVPRDDTMRRSRTSSASRTSTSPANPVVH